MEFIGPTTPSYSQNTCESHGFTMITAAAFGYLPWLEAQRVPLARNVSLIARLCLNIRVASAAPPVPLREVDLEASSWSHQAWCRLTCTRPR